MFSKMVGQGGLEPPRYCYHLDLNQARLPISPLTEKGLAVFATHAASAKPIPLLYCLNF